NFRALLALVIWPQATGGTPDPARLAAAAVTLAVGLWSKNVIAAILSGAAVLGALLWLLG
ncbi:MAG TPA: AzlD domain-containing protein, partial [Rhodobacteraceae bacterium]|nr:AzlD domain-containing protein [Paracoccaceae bacterium]